MAKFCFAFRVAMTISFLFILQSSLLSSAQQPDPNRTADDDQQSTGCSRLAVLPALPLAKTVSCHDDDSVEVTLPLKPAANGDSQEKRVRGPYQFREYQMRRMDQSRAFDMLLDSLPMSGFIVKYSNKPSTITGKKGDTWLLINVGDETYNVSVVEGPLEAWTPVKTADEISRAIQAHYRVDIYGIEFSSHDQSILEGKSPILLQILQYLKENADVSIRIESDKVSSTGTPEDDAEITRERANAVMDWLIAHGIARSRLQPWPAGRNNPITENDSPSAIQRNERIVLIRVAT